MKKNLITLFIITSFICSPAYCLDFRGINPVDPLDNNPQTYIAEPINPAYKIKRATLTRNSIKNQYTIAMNKFMQSNVRSSYMDFRNLIDSMPSNDYAYMRLTQEMAAIGFFNLSELAMSKIQDNDITSALETDVKNFYYPSSEHSQKDQLYLAEMYSNMMYNDQSREATAELMKQTSLLMDSDYANYLVAFGSSKTGNIKQAKEYINKAIAKNPTNINYKRLKSEILAQTDNPKDAISCLNSINLNDIHTVIFDKEMHSTQEYVLYKSAKNDYLKKYHLAHYYYDKGELNKSLGVLQTSISGKKNINKDVYALTAKVYFELKEFEKAQDYALKSIDIQKENTLALTVLGDIALRNKNYNEAQKYYRKIGSRDGSHYGEIALAKTYQKLNEQDKAKNIYSKILKESSKAYEAYYQMALIEKDRENIYLKKSVAINPNFIDGWIDLARLEIKKEDFDKAMAFLGISKYIDENNDRYYYYLGLIQKNKGLMAEAHKNFERSLELNPDNLLAKKELNI